MFMLQSDLALSSEFDDLNRKYLVGAVMASTARGRAIPGGTSDGKDGSSNDEATLRSSVSRQQQSSRSTSSNSVTSGHGMDDGAAAHPAHLASADGVEHTPASDLALPTRKRTRQR